MILIKRSLLTFSVFLTICCLLIPKVGATTTTFSVTKNEEVTRTLQVAENDRVTIKFSVVGRFDGTITFSLTFPNGTKREFGEVGVGNYLFVSDEDGTCIMYFSNNDSVEDKFVTLYYEVQHYIFGVPEMFFFTMIIILVCLSAVAVFILMAKPH